MLSKDINEGYVAEVVWSENLRFSDKFGLMQYSVFGLKKYIAKTI